MVSFADMGKMWGICIKFRLLHNQLQVPHRGFKLYGVPASWSWSRFYPHSSWKCPSVISNLVLIHRRFHLQSTCSGWLTGEIKWASFNSHPHRSLWSVCLQVNLGSHQYLFTVDVNPSDMPCLCLRHDVDALVWQPRPDQPSNMWEHIATFNALGKCFNQKHLLWCFLSVAWIFLYSTHNNFFPKNPQKYRF